MFEYLKPVIKCSAVATDDKSWTPQLPSGSCQRYTACCFMTPPPVRKALLSEKGVLEQQVELLTEQVELDTERDVVMLAHILFTPSRDGITAWYDDTAAGVMSTTTHDRQRVATRTPVRYNIQRSTGHTMSSSRVDMRRPNASRYDSNSPPRQTRPQRRHANHWWINCAGGWQEVLYRAAAEPSSPEQVW